MMKEFYGDISEKKRLQTDELDRFNWIWIWRLNSSKEVLENASPSKRRK